MNAAISRNQHPAESLDPERRAQRKASIVTVLLLALAMAGAFLMWLSSRQDAIEALRELPAEQRHELFEATRRSLVLACEPARRPAGLDDYCSDQATFLLRFDECDAQCRHLASRARPEPTR